MVKVKVEAPFYHAIMVGHLKRVWAKDKKGNLVRHRGYAKFENDLSRIVLSLEESETAEEWLSTFAHEFLHVGITKFIPYLFGEEYDEKAEHKFIEKIEDSIYKNFKHLKGKRWKKRNLQK